MKIVTWNVNGIRARQEEVAAFVERERPDVLCLQEIKAARDHIPKTVSDLGGYWTYWHGTKGYSGVALLVRKELSYDPPLYIHPEFDHETRIAAARVGGVTVASIYVPNGGKDFAAKVRFLEAMAAYAAALRATGDRVVLCGDINIARSERDVHPRERKPGAIGQRSDERALFERILEEGALHDVARELAPDDEGLFTWWAPWRNMRARLPRNPQTGSEPPAMREPERSTRARTRARLPRNPQTGSEPPAMREPERSTRARTRARLPRNPQTGSEPPAMREPERSSSARDANIGWRLDYVLASGDLAARATACVSMREVGTSDHGPVVATFRDESGPS